MLYENLQIQAGELPAIEEVSFQRHPLRYRTLRLINLTIAFLVLSLAWIIPLIADAGLLITLSIAGGWLLLLAGFLVEELKGFLIRGYALREHDISYKHGFFRFSLTTVPFNRIQHSEISHGPIARLFRLATLKIYTAGGSSSDLKIAGLDPENAKKLRDYITKVTSSYE